LLVKNVNKQISNNRQQLTVAILNQYLVSSASLHATPVLKSFVKVKLLHACDWRNVNRHLHQSWHIQTVSDWSLESWCCCMLKNRWP